MFGFTSLKDWNAIPGGSLLGGPRPEGFDEHGRHVLKDVGEFVWSRCGILAAPALWSIGETSKTRSTELYSACLMPIRRRSRRARSAGKDRP